MAITHTITVGKKSKRKTWKDFTPQEKEAYFKEKNEKMAKEKLAFVESIISYAKEKEHFPWQEPNFVRAPKSIAKLEALEKYNKEHPDEPKRRSEANYRGTNSIKLCKAADDRGFKDSRWVTVGHLKANKAYVKESERGKGTKIWIVNPNGRIVKRKNPETNKMEVVYKKDEKTGNFILDKEGEKIPLKEKTYTMTTVFNVEQTEGLTLKPEPPMKELDTTHKCPEMETIIAHSEAKIYHDQYSGGKDSRYYAPFFDEIHLPPVEQFKSMSSYYATAAHEIGHSTGHEKRLNRDMGGTSQSKSYAREELVAELTSVFLSQELEIKIPQKELDNHAEYIRSWDEKIQFLTKKPDELIKVITDAQKATDYIRDHMLEKYLEKDKQQALDAESKNVSMEKEPMKQEKEMVPKVLVPAKAKGNDMGR